MKIFSKSIIILFALFIGVGSPTVAHANHPWANYHWPRSSNPFTLTLGDNLSSQWDFYLRRASNDWSRSSRLDTKIVNGNISPTTCKGNTAQIQICNASYGQTGWLGLAQIGVNGDHILYGSVKVNDYYFSQSRYNTTEWKRLVMCQEVGHTLGLGHQDENFDNTPLGSCMDYTRDPNPNQRPNMADYYTLLDIYRHLDTTTALAADESTLAGDFSSDWGNVVKGEDRRGNTTKLAGDTNMIAVFEKDLGSGKKVNTIVIWAQNN